MVPATTRLPARTATIPGRSDGADFLTENGADQLMGGAGDDMLFGDAGNDWLVGGDGADQLHGGVDNDRMDGGAGTISCWATRATTS